MISVDEQKELTQKISRVLSDLEFRIFTLYVGGMSCTEICEATGKTTKSVDNALQRSKTKLQKCLKNNE
jgi:RNA polymerase sporulation-specific sigma factor